MNSSVSLTLDQVSLGHCLYNVLTLTRPLHSGILLQGDLHTMTTVMASKTFPEDKFWLNGSEFALNKRAQTVLKAIRLLAQDKVDSKTGEVIVKKEEWPQYHVHISSVNTFPTGAGLASSAAGLACLVHTLAKVYNAKETFPGEFSAIARQGSGSASRSLYGGFVRWQKGERADATDSIAIQIADENVSSLRNTFILCSTR